jgi:hypothetical protein
VFSIEGNVKLRKKGGGWGVFYMVESREVFRGWCCGVLWRRWFGQISHLPPYHNRVSLSNIIYIFLIIGI